jgi:hypothetical protein
LPKENCLLRRIYSKCRGIFIGFLQAQSASITDGNAMRELEALGIIRLYLQVQKPHLLSKYRVVTEGMWRVARNPPE